MISISPSTGAAPDGTALGLLRAPYVFTQDHLLRSDAFVSAAKQRGIEIDLMQLSRLHERGVFLPLYRVDDEAIEGRRINQPGRVQHPAAQYAHRGQVRDPAIEGLSRWWPYIRPPDAPRNWWDGYLFSRWQLLELPAAITAGWLIDRGEPPSELRRAALTARRLTVLLCALAPRHFSSVWGQISVHDGNFAEFREAQRTIGDLPRLALAGVEPSELQPQADRLLRHARAIDPNIGLWPLLRHAGHLGWTHLTGQALDAVEHRIAAEMLLRAHEHLADDGWLAPLESVSRQGSWQPRHDRITDRDGAADSLERALGSYGLSPYPRVLLVVEGETERIHTERLLDEYGLDHPRQVRVHALGGSRPNPHVLAEYVVSPRVGPAVGDRRLVESTPTALFIAMDPENRWTADRVEIERRKLQNAVRLEVERQDAAIQPDELDLLIHVFTWGEHSYELANFPDLVLIDVLGQLAREQGKEQEITASWRSAAQTLLEDARTRYLDIKAVMQRLHLRVDKPRLAELLLPALIEAADRDLPLEEETVPVLRMMNKLFEVYVNLPDTAFSLTDAKGRHAASR